MSSADPQPQFARNASNSPFVSWSTDVMPGAALPDRQKSANSVFAYGFGMHVECFLLQMKILAPCAWFSSWVLMLADICSVLEFNIASMASYESSFSLPVWYLFC